MSARNSFQSPNRRHDRRVFYKYVTAKVAKIVVSTRKLRWSSPVLFNDPFDITQELRLAFDEGALNRALASRLASMIEGADASQVTNPAVGLMVRLAMNAPEEKRKIIARELRETSRVTTAGQIEAMAMLKATWKEMVPRFRVICFSELNDVTPMWLHYADGYKGVALEFTAVDEVDSPLLVARPVTYQDDPPGIANVDAWVDRLIGKPGADYWDLFSELEYIKALPWSYEKEWRIASFARPGETGLFADYGFFTRELTGIYFGPKCEQADREDLIGMLRYGLEHVATFEAIPRIVESRFSFKPIQ